MDFHFRAFAFFHCHDRKMWFDSDEGGMPRLVAQTDIRAFMRQRKGGLRRQHSYGSGDAAGGGLRPLQVAKADARKLLGRGMSAATLAAFDPAVADEKAVRGLLGGPTAAAAAGGGARPRSQSAVSSSAWSRDNFSDPTGKRELKYYSVVAARCALAKAEKRALQDGSAKAGSAAASLGVGTEQQMPPALEARSPHLTWPGAPLRSSASPSSSASSSVCPCLASTCHVTAVG